jgi:essential nuclear protein 1
LDPKTSKRIFELARDQQDEMQMAEEEEEEEAGTQPTAFVRPRIEADDDDEDSELGDVEDEDVEEIFVSLPLPLQKHLINSALGNRRGRPGDA